MNDNTSPKVTTREWWLILFLISLIQFVVQSSAFVYCGKGSALNYWSLVGTSVSIILALLAIIWSFIQNMVQQNGSSSIASQIERLRSVVLDATKSSTEFSGQIDRLNEVRGQLQETAELTRQSRADIADMGKRMETTQKLVEGLTQKPLGQVPPPQSSDTVASAFSNYLPRCSLSGAVLVYACHLSYNRKVGFDLAKLCQTLPYTEHPYAHGFVVASSSAGIFDYNEASGIINVTAFSGVVAEDIRNKVYEKIKPYEKDSPDLASKFIQSVEAIEAMFKS